MTSINLEIDAEFATARSRFKLVINSCYFGLARTFFCDLENINNFNKDGTRSDFQKILVTKINQIYNDPHSYFDYR